MRYSVWLIGGQGREIEWLEGLLRREDAERMLEQMTKTTGLRYEVREGAEPVEHPNLRNRREDD